MRLLQEQGFTEVQVAGSALSPPALLSRQSVVMGISDGEVRAPPPAEVPRQLQAAAPPLADGILEGFKAVQLQNLLPPGTCQANAD